MRDWETAITVPEGVQQQRVDVVLEPSWLVKVLLQNAAGTPLHEALATLAKSVPALASLDYSDAVQVIALWHEIPDVLPRSELRISTTPLSCDEEPQGDLEIRIALDEKGVAAAPRVAGLAVEDSALAKASFAGSSHTSKRGAELSIEIEGSLGGRELSLKGLATPRKCP